MSDTEQTTAPPIAVVGIPADDNSSFMRGPRLAPERIRQVLHSGAANMTSECGIELGDHPGWRHVGDLDLPNRDADQPIEAGVRALLDAGHPVISLGGDHSVTFPILRALSGRHTPLTIVHLDAHPDLYDELDGNRLSHASPFARIMEAGLCQRLIQIGIRTLEQHQRQQARRFGVEMFHARDWSLERLPDISGAVYLSLDLDVLDPAFAPGVSHHEPGGLTTRDVLGIIQELPGTLIGADIVELNPHRDLIDMTAMVAAKCLKEILARMLRNLE